jgi:hypothetical protein
MIMIFIDAFIIIKFLCFLKIFNHLNIFVLICNYLSLYFKAFRLVFSLLHCPLGFSSLLVFIQIVLSYCFRLSPSLFLLFYLLRLILFYFPIFNRICLKNLFILIIILVLLFELIRAYFRESLFILYL